MASITVSDTGSGSGAITTGSAVQSGGGFTWIAFGADSWSRSAGNFDNSGSQDAGLVVDLGNPDVDITVDISANGGNGIVLRYLDANNYIRVVSRFMQNFRAYGDGYMATYKHMIFAELVSGGSVVTLGSATWKMYTRYPPNNDQDPDESMTLRVRAYKDQFYIWRNGGGQFGFTTTAFLTATKHGVAQVGIRLPSDPGYDYSIEGSAKNYLNDFVAKTIWPLAPSFAYPVNSGIVPTSIPIAQVALNPDFPEDQKIQVQYSKSSTFSSGVISITQLDTEFKKSGVQNVSFPSGVTLDQNIWYARARSIDRAAATSAWSATVSFEVKHLPGTINHSPSGSKYVPAGVATRLQWTFSDSYSLDQQTAYQITIERNDTGDPVLDTGKISIANQYRDVTIDNALKGVPLRWRVRVWDLEDKVGAYSSYQVFSTSDVSSFALTAPANGSTISNSAPEFGWIFTPVIVGRVQKSFRFVVTDDATSSVVYDSGFVQSSTARTHKPPFSILQNDKSYTVTLSGTDNFDLPITTSSIGLTVEFTTPPAGEVEVDPTTYGELGYMKITWTTAPSDSFVAWRIYRREVGSTWSLIADVTNPLANEYHDWMAPSQVAYEYAVVQMVYSFGEVIESDLSASVEGYAENGGYWLIDGIDNEASVRLSSVAGEQFKSTIEQSELFVVGRGRHVDKGEDWGRSGTLDVKIRDDEYTTARQKRQRILEMVKAIGPIYLRNPFGDIYQVSLGDPDFTRIIAGPSEFVDFSLPYSEVGQ